MTATEPRSQHRPGLMPSDVVGQPSLFDRFATWVAGFASRAYFFAACLLIVVLWLPSYFVIGDLNTWQLIINTLTTIVTFLLVALLQNTQTRAEAAMQQKLNAIADGLADLMGALAADHPELANDRRELADAVGLEQRESA
jgi:low affinity Fe/Cu permease